MKKYSRNNTVKMRGKNLHEQYIYTGHKCLIYYSRWVLNFIILFTIFTNYFLFNNWSLVYMESIAIKQQCISYHNIATRKKRTITFWFIYICFNLQIRSLLSSALSDLFQYRLAVSISSWTSLLDYYQLHKSLFLISKKN